MNRDEKKLEVMPEYLKSWLEEHRISIGEVEAIASTDMSIEGYYNETWLVVTKSNLLIIEGKIAQYGRLKDWSPERYYCYLLSGLEELKPEALVSGGMLTARVEGRLQLLCRYSGSHTRKIGLLVKLAVKIKEGKELEEKDFEDEHAPKYCPKCGSLYPEQEREICPKCLDKRALFKRVLSYMPRYRREVILIILCMIISSGLNLINPYLGGKIFFDEVLMPEGRYSGKLLAVVLLMVAIRLSALFVSIIYGRINSAVSAKISFDLKSEIFAAMQKLSLNFYGSRQTGALMNHVNRDSQELQGFFHDGIPYFIVNSMTITGIVIMMFSVNWKLALCVLLPIPLIIYVLVNLFPKLWSGFGRTFRKNSSMNSLINDTLTGARVVKGFGKEQAELQRFEGVNEEVQKANLQLWRLIFTAFPLLNYAMGIGGFIVWAIGGWQVARGNMSFGTLITFTGYIGMLYGPLQFMTQIVQWWSGCMNAASRMFEIIDAVPQVKEASKAIKLPDIKGHISINNVSFGYEPNRQVLKDIRLYIKAGEMIGIVGHSGAGKSTLMNLITRLYDVNEGQILIDGIDLREIAVKDLRTQIGLVLQETYLFMGTIAENIAYARPEATMEEIIAAAKAANAHDFILKLSDGYDTVIGQRGLNLSGGERQRLSIARTILQNPKILILDEATASLDTETEKQIQEALEGLIKGRTTISIAHRLSTLRNADRLVVIENGAIAEEGTHAELVKKRGIYFTLLQKQSEALKLQGVS